MVADIRFVFWTQVRRGEMLFWTCVCGFLSLEISPHEAQQNSVWFLYKCMMNRTFHPLCPFTSLNQIWNTSNLLWEYFYCIFHVYLTRANQKVSHQYLLQQILWGWVIVVDISAPNFSLLWPVCNIFLVLNI